MAATVNAVKRSPPLTEQESAALDLATSQGGKLYRNDAGWGLEVFDGTTAALENIYSAQTVKALVARGAMEWTLWDRVGGTKYPIEATCRSNRVPA